jgi:hypothetical protein
VLASLGLSVRGRPKPDKSSAPNAGGTARIIGRIALERRGVCSPRRRQIEQSRAASASALIPGTTNTANRVEAGGKKPPSADVRPNWRRSLGGPFRALVYADISARRRDVSWTIPLSLLRQ